MAETPEKPEPSADTRRAIARRSSAANWPVRICLTATVLVAAALWWLSNEVAVENIQPPRVPAVSANSMSDSQAAGDVTRNPGYLGPDRCAECHRERVDEFLRTNHFRTCRIPRSDELPPELRAGTGHYAARFPGTRFEMTRRGEQFFQTTIRETPRGEERLDSRIDLILGAGKADDVYLSWHPDGQMFELPISWLWTKDCWGASHFLTPFGTGDYSRAMTVRCMECHNTWMDYQPGTVNQYSHDTAIPGVSCERCHGPGADHVKHHQDHPGDLDAVSIVKPAQLDRERLIEVCTQCHSNAIAHRQPPFSYRPGQPLSDFFLTLAIRNPEDDHVANQIDNLRQSRCFQQSETMTCVTCHDPHRSRPPDENLSASCHQCHQTHDCIEQPRLPQAVQNDCVGCHMPKRIKINVKFETEHDNFVPPASRFQHRIAVDPIARDAVLLAWYRSNKDPANVEITQTLTDRLMEYWSTRARQHQSQSRFLAAIADYRESLDVSDTPEVRQHLEGVISAQKKLYDDWAAALNDIAQNQPQLAIEKLKGLLKIRPDDAEAHAKLGTLYAMTGQKALAIPHLEAVARHDPNNGSGFGVLGRLAWLEEQYEQALTYWQQAEALDPFNAQTHYDIGLTLVRLQRLQEARQSLEHAAQIDPLRDDIRSVLQALSESTSQPLEP